jgi:hypothetical protein
MSLWVKPVRLALLQVVVGVLRDGSIDPHAGEAGAVIAALALNASQQTYRCALPLVRCSWLHCLCTGS